jgi:tyrosyl-tRNA synthetase
MIVPGFELCTDLSSAEIHDIKTAIKNGENPMTFKKALALSIVTWLAGSESAERAATHFASVHQKGEKPDQIETVSLGKEQIALIDALVESGLCASKSDARRQIEQNGIKVADAVVSDVKATLKLDSNPLLIQKGKRHFVNVTV